MFGWNNVNKMLFIPMAYGGWGGRTARKWGWKNMWRQLWQAGFAIRSSADLAWLACPKNLLESLRHGKINRGGPLIPNRDTRSRLDIASLASSRNWHHSYRHLLHRMNGIRIISHLMGVMSFCICQSFSSLEVGRSCSASQSRMSRSF